MGQPTAEKALKELASLVGEWTLEAIPPGGEPWPGEARSTIEWHDSGAHLVERSTAEMPEAPDGISIMGCDAANGTYYRLYSDEDLQRVRVIRYLTQQRGVNLAGVKMLLQFRDAADLLRELANAIDELDATDAERAPKTVKIRST